MLSSVKAAYRCSMLVFSKMSSYLFYRGRTGSLYARCKLISAILSVALLVVNMYIWVSGCQSFQSFIPLRHGHLPVFPHHFYPLGHQVPASSFANSLDQVFHTHISHSSLNRSIPPVVHIVHCDPGPFTFPHYLSVVSAFKIVKPSAMFIHTKSEPELDPDGYYQFLPDLLRDIPILLKVKLKNSYACSSSGQEQSLAYASIIGNTGGFAINSRTVISPSQAFSSVFDRKNVIASINDVKSSTLLLTQEPEMSSSASSSSFKYHSLKCPNPATFLVLSKNADPCVYLQEDMFPSQIFSAETDLALLARWLAYGSTEKLVPKQSEREIVPNIVHYVWLGKRKLDYFAYLSFLSSLYVLEADAVYIHGEAPLGEYWERINNEPRIKLIRRDFPDSVYGTPIVKFVSHASDYLRADILIRYGGVYADTDVIFLQKLPSSVRRYNTTASVDWPSTGAFPDVFNMGVLVAAPGAPYLRYFLESYRWYLDGDWSYNAIHIPYKVYEKKPHTLNVDRKLQVLCALDKCHATWVAGYKREDVDHLNDRAFDWRTDAIAIHWTHPDPKEFANQGALLSSKSITADLGQMVLRRAKIIS